MAQTPLPPTSPVNPTLPRLELLHDAAPAPPYLELVAIHGAFEPDPTRTWTHTTPGAAGGAEAPGVNWLADDAMLPSQVPHLRSWSFAYDTTPVAARDGGLQQHLARTAAGLRQVLEDQILADSTRPLLFVGHGYGGLVALKSLIDPHLRGRCAGVVCLGTPFRPVDMDNAIMETLPIAGRGSVQTLAVLADEFDTLPALLADFRDAPGTSAVPIRCFYETEPLRYNGMTRFIVPKEAAVLNDPNAMSFALDDVNHANMNKFLGPDDHNYELTRDVIFGLVEHAYPFLLTQAILNGDAEYCQKIVSAHSDSFATNESLSDALRAAVTTSQSNILQMLLDANIRVNALLDDYGDTALILAVRSEASNRNVVVLQLLEKGADKDVLNANQKSAVDYAMDTNDVDLQRMLQDGPLLVGPVLKRATFDLISQPQMNIRDYNCTRNIYAKVADVYEVRDRERTFLRTPSVYDLIYEYGPRMLMNRERSKETEMGTKKFRWLHLPANNLQWMKDLIQKTYREMGQEPYFLQKFMNITDRSHWEERISTSPVEKLKHIRHLWARCETIPYDRRVVNGNGKAKKEHAKNEGEPKQDGEEAKGPTPAADVILFMPYLHYEYTQKREEMKNTIDQVRGGIRVAPPKYVTNTPDQNAIWAYLRHDIPLHMRRTLDQYYYDALDSDSSQRKGVLPRNLDQVTQRFMKSQEQFKNDDTILLMVDQLWMVLLEDDTLITAFPRRWGEPEVHLQNPVKDAAIADMISKELSNTDREAMDSPYDMMMTIIELCTGVLFNSAVHRNEKLRFAEFFVRRIQTVTNQEAESFGYLKTQFEQLSKENKARDKDETLQRLLDELLDISDEVSMLNEIKDVHDELEMVGSIFDTQIQVLEQMDGSRMPPAAHRKWVKIIADIRQRRDKVTELDESAHRTLKAIQSLFDMKQRQANVLEAHYSRKVAQDSGRQATTVLVFTVVTIVFLPLSFMSSFFAIPVKEFPRDDAHAIEIPLAWVSARLFSVAIGIAVAIVVFVFGINAGITRLPGRTTPPRAEARAASVGAGGGPAAASNLAGSTAVGSPATGAVSSSGFMTAATGAVASMASAAAAAGGRTFIRTPSGHRLLVDRKRVAAERLDRRSVFSYDSFVRGAGEVSGAAARYVVRDSVGGDATATTAGSSRPGSGGESPLRAAFAARGRRWRWTGPAGDENGEAEKGGGGKAVAFRAPWEEWREDGGRKWWFWRRRGW